MKNKKKNILKLAAITLAAALAAMTFAGCSGTQNGSADDEKTLNLFTYDGYVPQDVLDGYTEQTGVHVNYTNFESNEEMLAKLQAADGGDYDIIICSDYMIDLMRQEGGLIRELDTSKLSNYGNIDPAYQSQFYDPDNQYTIPYAPGVPLIVYNPETCPVEIEGYADLWNPELADSLVVMDSSRIMVGITLKTMGKSMNETDPEVLGEAEENLLELKPNVRTMAVNDLDTVLTSGEASVGFMYTSQVAKALEANPDLKVVYPKEGLGFGIDCIVVPENAPHADNAYSFIDYCLDPEIGAKISSEILYLCPNQASVEYLPADFRETLSLPEEKLQNVEFIKDVGDVANEYERIWTAFKQA